MNYNPLRNSIIVNNTLGLPKTGKGNEEFEKCSRRALVLSSEDVDGMAVASSRARLMMELVRNPDDSSRELESHFRTRKEETKPYYACNTTTTSIPIPNRIIPTYPTQVQNMRWKNDETYSEDSQKETDDDEEFHCRCHKCKMKQCKNRKNPGINKKSFAFRDNIMRFTDNSTMTPKLIDACCEVCTHLPRSPKTSDIYISTSDIDIRNPIQRQATSTDPIPILKKPERDTYSYSYHKYDNEKNTSIPVNSHNEAARESHKYNDYEELLSSIRRREFVSTTHRTSRDNATDCGSCRNNLYNEGISDSIAETTIPQFHGQLGRMQPPMQSIRKDFSRFHGPIRLSIKRDFNRMTNNCIGEKDVEIPYAHREQSKYHYGCRKPVKKVDFQYDDDCDRPVDHRRPLSPRIPRPTQVAQVSLCGRPTNKLPKKLLTSERDIDSFIGNKRTTSKSKLFRLFSSCK